MRSPLCAAAFAAGITLALAGCVTGGMDDETKAALRATMDSVQKLTELWQERLDALDDGGGTGDDDRSAAGAIEPVGTHAVSPGGSILPDFATFTGWGYWGKNDDGTTLFRATITASADVTDDGPENAIYFSSVTGLRAFDNPEETEGSATWSGKVRGVDRGDFAAITGDAEVEYDFLLDWVNVRFDSFSDARLPLTWNDVPVYIGRFSRGLKMTGTLPWIEGTFYGDDHEGVAGEFHADNRNFRGVFGALRE